MTYTVEQLAPGSYDVLRDGHLLAALTREIDRGGKVREWQVELLDETPPADRPEPFTAQRHVFASQAAALEWLGIRGAGEGADDPPQAVRAS